MTIKSLIGALCVILTLVGYAPYIRGTLQGRIKPHMFSWIVWGLAYSIAFFAQLVRDAGPGAWFTGVSALLCLILIGLSARGEKDITRSDTVALVVGLSAIPASYLTNDPFLAVILAGLVDVIGIWPTVRKAYHKPHDEAVFPWAVSGIRPLISLFALEHYSSTTVLFPIVMSANNFLVAIIVLWRGRDNNRRSN